MARQLEMERGSIKMLTNRMIMLPSPFFSYLLKTSKNPIEMGKLIYYSSKLTTYNHFTYLLEKHYGLSFQGLEKWQKEVAELGGWGEIEIINVNWEKKEAIITVKNSPISEMMGLVNYAVDHETRGFTAGAISIIFKKDIEVLETKCTSKGDNLCEFIVQPKEKFSFKDKIVKNQLYTDKELEKNGWMNLFRNRMEDVKDSKEKNKKGLKHD